jgi:hypothetical protein
MGASSGSTAVGYQAAYSGGEQAVTAFGYQAGYSQAGANPGSNTWIGYQAGYFCTSGGANTALGYQAYANASNATGSYNTAIGMDSLRANTTGSYNNALGYQAGYSTTTGTSNTYIGTQCGYFITTGSKNTILGGYTGNAGGLDIRTASNYIVLSDGDGNPRMYLNGSGYPFFPQVRSNAGSYTAKWTTSAELVLDTSSARYKDNIRDSAYGLSHVMQIRSAMFEYKADGRTDVGLVAEELDLIIPELVTKNAENQPDAVSYDRMVSVLIKAIQELKAEVDSLKSQLNQGA